MRIVGLLAVILLYFGGGGIYAYDFQKCTDDIAYWYNYYYDPGALLKANFDSTKHPPTSDTTLTSTQNRRDKDSIITPRSDSADVPIIPIKPTELPVTRIEYIDNDPKLYDDYLVTVIKGVPYVEAQMGFEGDRSILESLGVRIFMQGSADGGYGVSFPLSILPQLDTLTSMILIESFPKLQDNYPMAFKVNKVANTAAHDFQKCDINIVYWYYYYYEPEKLVQPPYKIMAPVSRLNSPSDSLKDDSVSIKSNSTDSASLGQSPIAPNKKAEGEPEWHDYRTFKPDSSFIGVENGIPFMGAAIYYNGNDSELRALGVSVAITDSICLSAVFPIQLLPSIDSLPSVIRILPPGSMEFSR